MMTDHCDDFEPKVVVDVLSNYYGARYVVSKF